MVKLQVSSQGKVYVTANNKALVANEPTGTKHITSNGTHDVKNYATANVNITPNLGTKYISANGTYDASTDNYDGFSSVTVNVSGGGEGGADPISVISQNTVGGNLYGSLMGEWMLSRIELKQTVFKNLTGLTLPSELYTGSGNEMWGNVFVDSPMNISSGMLYSMPTMALCYVGIDEYTDPTTSQQTSGWVIRTYYGDISQTSGGQGFPPSGKNCYCISLEITES